MARVAAKSMDDYPWYIKLICKMQKKKYGAPLEPTLLWGRTPKVFLGFLLIQKGLNRKDSPLDPILRTLVSVKISELNGCAFCIDMNSFLLLQKGGSEKKLEALAEFRNNPIFSEEEKVALEYAEVVVGLSAKISDEFSKKMKIHFTDDEIVELTALIGYQNLSCKFNTALDITAFGFCKK